MTTDPQTSPDVDIGLHVARGGPVLTDGAIETRVPDHPGVIMDPVLGSVSLISDQTGRAFLEEVYGGYLADAAARSLPAVVGTPTFRASRRWAEQVGAVDDVVALNREAVSFLRGVRDRVGHEPTWIAGVIGPAGDAYQPDQALPTDDARSYHRTQVEALANAGVDFLFAPTFPAVVEAVGVAQAMAASGLPFVVSFVLGADGALLDGHTLADAIAAVDAMAPPTWFSLSCVHPTVAHRALLETGPSAAARVREVKANASALPPDQLVTLDHVDHGDPATWANEMAELHQSFGIPVLGGCCGTDDRHLRALANLLVSAA